MSDLPETSAIGGSSPEESSLIIPPPPDGNAAAQSVPVAPPTPQSVPSEPAPEPIVAPIHEEVHPEESPISGGGSRDDTPPKNKRPGSTKKTILITTLLLLLIALPVGLYFVNQQASLNDTRSRANPPPGEYPNVSTRAQCEQFGEVRTEPGAECGCGGYRIECFINGHYYKIGCEYNPNANCGGGDTPTPTVPQSTNTPTATSTITITPTPTLPVNTPTNTLTPTPTTPGNTATPTPTPQYTCNSGCTVNTDCSNSLVCVEGKCRNATCSEKTTCQCDVVSPTPKTPVAGTGPSVLGATTIAGAFLLILLGLAL